MRNWSSIKSYQDIKFEFFEGIAKITINRPQVYNAFRPETNMEMLDAMNICRERNDIGVVILTGAGDKAFVSGADITQFEDMRAAKEAVARYELMAEQALMGGQAGGDDDFAVEDDLVSRVQAAGLLRGARRHDAACRRAGRGAPADRAEEGEGV